MNGKVFDVSHDELRNIKRVLNLNYKISALYSKLLNECPRAITPELMSSLCDDGTDKETAYLSVLSYMFDIDEENENDKYFTRKYLVPSIKQASVSDYLDCEYRKLLGGMVASFGEWRIGEDKYAAYEAFPCGEGAFLYDFTQYPQIAFFDTEFSFPTVSQGGVEWMSLKPNEIETMREPIENASGNVLVFGLGLGYYTYCVSEKENVRSVTVVEKDENIISLFKEKILPFFKNREKIRIVRSDAFLYMREKMNKSNADFVFTDIWHDTSDGLELYLRAKKYENMLNGARFEYWIERSILARLRAMVFEEYFREEANILTGLPNVYGIEGLTSMLSDASLRELSKRIALK